MRYLTGVAAVATIVVIASGVSLAARAQTTDQPAAAPATTPVVPAPTPAPVPSASAPASAAPATAENPVQTPPSAPVVVAPAAASPVAPPPNGTPATVMDLGEVDGVLGKNVRSTAGDDMGRIIDVMVGANGQVHAAIIDFGGFLGVGSRKVAVDWRALQFASEGKVGRITTGLSRNQIRLAPEYKNGEAVVVLNAPGATSAAAPVASPAAAAPVVAAPASGAAPNLGATTTPGATTVPGAAPTPADDTSAQRPKPAP